MHTVVLFGLSVSEFLESQSIFLGTFHHLKGHFKFWTLGFFGLLVIRHLLFLLMKPGREAIRQGPRLDKPRSRPVCGSHVNHVNTLLRDCHNCHTNTRLYNSRCVCFFNQLTTLSARKGDLVPVTSRIKGDLEFVDF